MPNFPHLLPHRAVLTLGACAWTTIFKLPAWPLGSAKILPQECLQLGDGMSASAGCSIAALGGRAAWWGRVGDDSSGRAAVASLSDTGLDCTQVHWVAGVRGSICTVLVDPQGERLVVPFHDPAMPNSAAWLPIHSLRNYAAVLTEVRWFEGARAILAAARQQGVHGVLDAEASVPGELAQLCSLSSHILFSETGLAHYLGEAGAKLGTQKGLAQVMRDNPLATLAGVTLGAKGFWIERINLHRLQSVAAPAVQAVDTLAAGDVFHGVYAYSLASGLSAQECAELSVLAASVKCQTFGGRLGAPGLEQLLGAWRAS
jgi:sulfofructose kinase